MKTTNMFFYIENVIPIFDYRILVGAGVEKDWPKGRGIFHNDAKTFLAWLNEEDHIRIISMQMGGNLAEVTKRLVTVSIKFIKNMRYKKQKAQFLIK